MHFPLATALRRAALALAVAATLAPLFAPPPAKAADLTGFYTDFASEELMRLTNLDRRALGKSSLKVDQFLVSLARDREFKCPSNGNTYRGRARDMAVRDYMSHSVKGCRKKNGSPFTIQTILRKHGYSTYTGENIGVNNWPDTGATYKYGCSSSGSGCDGTTTSTAPVATVQRMWMRSSGHRVQHPGRLRPVRLRGLGSQRRAEVLRLHLRQGRPQADRRQLAVRRRPVRHDSLRRDRQGDVQRQLRRRLPPVGRLVQIDGSTKSGWSYDLNVTGDTRRYTVDAASLSTGTHTLTWSVRDVAGHVTKQSVTFTIGS